MTEYHFIWLWGNKPPSHHTTQYNVINRQGKDISDCEVNWLFWDTKGATKEGWRGRDFDSYTNMIKVPW